MNSLEKSYKLGDKTVNFRKILNWDFRKSANELLHKYDEIEREITAKSGAKFLAVSTEILNLANQAASPKDNDTTDTRDDAKFQSEVFREAVTSDLEKGLEYQQAYMQFTTDKEIARKKFIYDHVQELISTCIEESDTIKIDEIEAGELETFAGELLEDFFLSQSRSSS